MSFKVSGFKRLIFPTLVLYRNLNTRYPLLSVLADLENRPKGESFSSLYISGRYGEKLYPTAIPHLGLNYFASNFDEIYQNWRQRDPKIQLDEDLKRKIHQLANINSLLGKLIAERKLDTETKETLKGSVKNLELRNSLKILCEEKWELEEEVIPIILNAPNIINPKVIEGKILGEFGKKPNLVNPKSCIALGVLNNYLEFTNASPNGYYLIGALAQLELNIIRYITLKLKNEGLKMVSLPSFVKSAIVEAGGKSPFNPNKTISVKEKTSKWGNLLHLLGSATVESYISYLTRMQLNSIEFPIVFFNVGRKYDVENVSESNRLLNPFQSSEIFTFAVDANENQSLETFDKLCACTHRVYESLQLPFRVKQCSTSKLLNIESLKIEFDLWSPFLNSYVNCGYIALYGHYLSQRLMMTHEKGFQSHIGGCVVNVTTLLTCMMENLQNSTGEIMFSLRLKGLKI